MDLQIRQENETDFPYVNEVHKNAFGQDTDANIVDALRKNREAFIPELSLVAMLDSEVVGHILFTRIEIISDSDEVFESLALASLAVKPGIQKRGIGGLLIRAGLAKAKALGYKSVIVIGHEHYSPKFGFVPAVCWDIKAPFDVPANVFMGLELVPDGLKGVKGTVKYPKEFDET